MEIIHQQCIYNTTNVPVNINTIGYNNLLDVKLIHIVLTLRLSNTSSRYWRELHLSLGSVLSSLNRELT